MGGFVDYRCTHCKLEMEEIPVGKGRRQWPYLALYRCTRCKTVGSTWIQENQPARCAVCFEEGVTLLPDDTTHIDCPKCGKPAQFTPRDGGWE